MLLERSLRVMLFAVCSTALAAGCGGLRRLPITADDAGPGGIGGSSASAGRGGGGGNAGTTGAGGSIAGTTGTGRVDDDRRRGRHRRAHLRRGWGVRAGEPLSQGNVRLPRGRRRCRAWS